MASFLGVGRGPQIALAVAVALAVLVAVRERLRASPPEPFGVEVTVTTTLATGGVVAATRCALGDDVTIRATRATAVWIYRGEDLIASCPGLGCRTRGGVVELTFQPAVATRHRVVAVSGAADLTSGGRFDLDVLAATTRGAQLELRVLDVVAPR